MLSRFIDVGLKLMDQERLVRASGFWDAAWYAERYVDAGGADKALSHFLKTGAKKGYDPGPEFSCSAYLSEHPDVAEAGINPLIHYLRFGRFEGRVARDAHGRPSGTRDHGLNAEALARVRQVFDDGFYKATNPDLPEDTDRFEHFMRAGWHQRRDPVDWFSVARYLAANEDVARAGENPFAHYVLTGCREGRRIAASTRLPVETGAANARLRLAVVAMVRNEADIIRVFARHVLALFDEIVIVDHRSDDGTAEYLAAVAEANPRVEILRLEEPSYIQSVTMTHVVRDRPQLRDADWVFFLDADEFLPFAGRHDLEQALDRFRSCPVISMRWQNLIPETYWDSEISLHDETPFLVPPVPSPFRKVAFQPARVPLERIVVAQGNHALVETLNGLELPVFDADFELLHLPVRSVDQIVLKLTQGVLAYQKIGKRRDAAQGTHWHQMKAATKGAPLSPHHLNALAERYSEEKTSLVPVSRTELLAGGYKSRTFLLASQDDGLELDMMRRSLSELLMCVHAVDYSDAATEDRPGAARLETRGHVLVRADADAEYAPLPAVADHDREPCLNTALSDFLRPSYAPIDDLVPSDWTGHIPFMFSLAAMLRPRRYVEMGTLRGASFFAFAQAARRAGLDCEAVAVSSWAVEPSRADEFRNVFEDFQYLACKYRDMSGILKISEDDALHRFADGSIDLLHLDGLHDFEGAERSFESWLPKLSTRGAVLIHDIGAVGHGFGVWRLWDRIKAGYPTIEFRHAQGLGLACIGADVPKSLRLLSDAIADEPALATMVQDHFESVAAMSAELFSRRYDMAQMEMRVGAEGAQTEELSWLRQELASLQNEAEELRKMVRGGVKLVAGQ